MHRYSAVMECCSTPKSGLLLKAHSLLRDQNWAGSLLYISKLKHYCFIHDNTNIPSIFSIMNVSPISITV